MLRRAALLASIALVAVMNASPASAGWVSEYQCQTSDAGSRPLITIQLSTTSSETRAILYPSLLTLSVKALPSRSQVLRFSGPDFLLEIDLSTVRSRYNPTYQAQLTSDDLTDGKALSLLCTDIWDTRR